MSLIEKIDAEIAKVNKIVRLYPKNEVHKERKRTLEEIKLIILSEQKEPCGWCKENYRFEFNWIDEEGNTVTTDDHMVIGGIAEYCPVCGIPLNQPSTDEA